MPGAAVQMLVSSNSSAARRASSTRANRSDAEATRACSPPTRSTPLPTSTVSPAKISCACCASRPIWCITPTIAAAFAAGSTSLDRAVPTISGACDAKPCGGGMVLRACAITEPVKKVSAVSVKPLLARARRPLLALHAPFITWASSAGPAAVGLSRRRASRRSLSAAWSRTHAAGGAWAYATRMRIQIEIEIDSMKTPGHKPGP